MDLDVVVGVPRILEGTLPRHLQSHKGHHPSSEADPAIASEDPAVVTDDEWEPFAAYMATTRINVNVRQVFPNGFIPPDSLSSSLAALDA